jgi:hypothetical protein
MNQSNGKASVFSKFIAENLDPQPSSTEKAIEHPLKNLELLLNWLMNRWAKNSVTLRDIFAYGPNSLRNKEVALALMQILSARGWVTPTRPHRYDMKRWEIARGPMARTQP